MNSDSSRRQMVEQQVRTWDVDDACVLKTMSALSRDQFVPPMYADLAYADTEIPLSCGQGMLRPALEGKILQSLMLDRDDRVLEIGTGSGYLSACLSTHSRSVTSIDIFDELVAIAKRNLSRAGIENANLHCMDAFAQLPDGHFDVIVVGGSTPSIVEHFVEALEPRGRMFALIGEAPIKSALLITKGNSDEGKQDKDQQDRHIETLFETEITELVNAPQNQPFHF